jgi:hypothetical protein
LGTGTALKELLGDYFPTRISQGAAALAGLSSAPTSAAAAIAPERFGRDVKLHEQWRRKVARQKTARGTFQWVLANQFSNCAIKPLPNNV